MPLPGSLASDSPAMPGLAAKASSTEAPLAYDDLSRLMSLMTGDEKHGTSATSTLDVLWVLYDRVLRASPETVNDPNRDRFLLSKGHGPMAYYAVLAAKGFVPVAELGRFAAYDSILGKHPDRNLVPGVEVASGSLGHGLPLAVGMALAVRARGLTEPRVFCLLGDAELDEGSNFEAIQAAARFGLGSLTAIVVRNDSASLGWPGGIATRFETEGWKGTEINGRDHAAIEAALRHREAGQPSVVVARVEAKS